MDAEKFLSVAGGPAFPFVEKVTEGRGMLTHTCHRTHPGMTLMDYFAEGAMRALIMESDGSLSPDEIAHDAFKQASEMLRVRTRAIVRLQKAAEELQKKL